MTAPDAVEELREPKARELPAELYQLPPSPPTTAKESSSKANSTTDFEIGESTLIPSYRPTAYPLPPPSRPIQHVLAQDLRTPDAHVERDPRLIRLTGVHPFNVEAPLTDLWEEGFLTTKDLHYVRNHGAVPLVHDEDVLDWPFTVEGLVENPLSLTLRDLLDDFEQVTYPITLVCAGNRRKEQNVVRKTKGFSWGAAGVSTALWTGVPLDVILARARPLLRGAGPKARYVCFEGADGLPNGRYATSIKLGWATDPSRGVLVAHAMNGEPLAPDHGRPLRIVVPGQIGGRSVKWLRRIVVTEAPSDSWYHIYDNRVLPTTVSPEASADLPDTWRDERYAIYELNVNSAVARPAHDERLVLPLIESSEDGQAGQKSETTSSTFVSTSTASYTFEGYAYAGGGRRVTRVELTLDRGRTWRLADVRYPEDEYRAAPDGETLFGGRLDVSWRETCFCWCFWSLDVDLADLADPDTCTGDVMVRAMDEAMMVQPRDMYWSVLGMMNNPWYRVVVHRDRGGQDGEVVRLRFEHPTQPALMPGGWMERVKKEGGDLANGYWGEKVGGKAEAQRAAPEPVKEIVMTSLDVKREIGMEDMKKHAGDEEPWFVLNGEVYDGTKFLSEHPGGAASITGAAGQDVSEEFMAIHSENAKAMMPRFHIGTLDTTTRKLLESGESSLDPNSSPSSSSRPVFLNPKRWLKISLTAKTPVSSDTKIFHFELEHPAQRLGLPTGQHLMLRLRDPATREVLVRAYTPLSGSSSAGQLDVLVKIYRASSDGAHPGGAMTQALDSLPLGHAVEVKGPVGRFEYLGGGRCTVGCAERRVGRFIMVCAGSGVTPVLAVLRAVADDEGDKETRCLLLDGNRREEDILCRSELAEVVEQCGERTRVLHTLTRPDEGWEGGRGRMDRKFFESEVGPPKSRTKDGEGYAGLGEMVLVCGPEPLERLVRESFLDMGWKEEDLLFF